MLRWASALSTKVASSLSDTFAPLFRSPLEQLQDAWRKAEQECQALLAENNNAARGLAAGGQEVDDPNLLINSPLVHHLNQLVEALMKEEEQRADAHTEDGASDATSVYDAAVVSGRGASSAAKSATGPCFEYFLQEKIIDKLCALGMPDRPVGMRPLVTKTLDAVLANTHHPILPSMSAHQSVKQFLDVCYTKEDHKHRGYRGAFLSLLHTIAAKIKQDHSLAGIFFDIFPAREKRPPEFLLFTALCAMMSESADGARAYESLLWIVQLPNASICEYVLQHSEFVPHTMTSLCNLFRALPSAADSPLLDDLFAASAAQGGTGYPELDSFFRRFHFIDSVMRSSYGLMQQSMGSQMSRVFLGEIIQPLLLDNRESVACWTTNFLKHLLMNAESVAMRHTLVEFLLGTDLSPEQPPPSSSSLLTPSTASPDGASPSAPASSASPSPSPSSGPSTVVVRNVLLRRLDSLSDALCIHTLDLFQTLIGLRDPLVMQNLLLRNLPSSSPSAAAAAGGALSPAAAAAVSALTPAPADILPIPQSVMFAGFNDLPDFASQAGSLEEYLLDAQLEGQLWMSASEDVYLRSGSQKPADGSDGSSSADGSAAATASPAASTSTSTAAAPAAVPAFYEGLFLSTLLNKLESLYDNSFSTNLKLTSVLAKLSYCPHTGLHHFLFNPDAAAVTGAQGAAAEGAEPPRLLLHVLRSVWNKGMKRAGRMPNFARRKEEARQRLNQPLQQASSSLGLPILSQASASVETMEGERFLRGLILLEEFQKELYAIAQSKARLFALQKLARLQGAVPSSPAMLASSSSSSSLASPRGVRAPRQPSLANGSTPTRIAEENCASPIASPAPAPAPAQTAAAVEWPTQAEEDADSLP